MRLLTPYWPSRRANADFLSEMERFFDDVASTRVETERRYAPSYDVAENEERYLLSVDLPGIKKEDIQIEMNENVLTISGERKRDEQVYKFARNFSLPRTVDATKIAAHYEDGVLSVTLPKATTAKVRKIEIQSKIGDTPPSETTSH